MSLAWESTRRGDLSKTGIVTYVYWRHFTVESNLVSCDVIFNLFESLDEILLRLTTEVSITFM